MAFKVIANMKLHDIRGRRKYLNEMELVRFLSAADRYVSKSKRALCYLVKFTGCRISEALGVRLEHLNVEDCEVTLLTLKRRRPDSRTVPIPEFVMKMLLAVHPAADGRLWAVCRVTAWRWIRACMLAIGIRADAPRACCRGLRHSYGVSAVRSGMQLPLIQKHLGHASPASTAVYLDTVGHEEREITSRMWRSPPTVIAAGDGAPRSNLAARVKRVIGELNELLPFLASLPPDMALPAPAWGLR